MRRAELVTAIFLACFSLYLMWVAGAPPAWNPDGQRFQNIGFVFDEGLGSGAWPFWLSGVMFLCCIWIIVNWVRRSSPLSTSDEPFLTNPQLITLAKVTGALLGFLLLIEIVGFYFAILLFLLLTIRFLGKHSWKAAVPIAVTVPVFFFLFFDIAMRVVLPKGYAEPLFVPLYNFFY